MAVEEARGARVIPPAVSGVPYDYELTKVWARITAEAERRGRRMETGDAWIAATAVHRSLPLYAHDRDFLGLGISGLSVVSTLDG